MQKNYTLTRIIYDTSYKLNENRSWVKIENEYSSIKFSNLEMSGFNLKQNCLFPASVSAVLSGIII